MIAQDVEKVIPEWVKPTFRSLRTRYRAKNLIGPTFRSLRTRYRAKNLIGFFE